MFSGFNQSQPQRSSITTTTTVISRSRASSHAGSPVSSNSISHDHSENPELSTSVTNHRQSLLKDTILEDDTEIRARYESQLRENQVLINDLKEQIKEYDNKVSGLTEENVTLKQQYLEHVSSNSNTKEAEASTNKLLMSKLTELSQSIEVKNHQHDAELDVYKNRLKSSHDIIESKERVIDKLKADIRELEKKSVTGIAEVMTAHDSHKEVTARENMNLSESLDSAHKQIEELKEKLRLASERALNAERLNSTLQLRVDDLTYTITSYSNESDSKQQLLESSSNVNTQLKVQITNLRNKIDELNKETNSLSSSNGELREKSTSLIFEMNTLKKDYESIINQNKLKIIDLENHIGNLSDDIESVTKDRDDLKLIIDNYKKENLEYKNNYLKLEKTHNLTLTHIDKLSNELDKSNKTLRDNEDDYRKTIKDLQNRYDIIIVTLKTKEVDYDALLKRLEQITNMKDIEIGQLKGQLLTDNDNYKKDVKVIKEQLTKTTIIKTTLENELKQYQDKEELYKSNINDLTVNIHSQRNKLDDLNNQANELKAAIIQAKLLNAQLNQENDELRVDNNKLRSDNDNLKIQLDVSRNSKSTNDKSLDFKIKDLQKVLDDLQNQHADLLTKYGITKEQLAAALKNNDSLKATFLALQSENNNIKIKIDELVNERDALKLQVSTLSTQVNTITKQKLSQTAIDKVESLNRQLKALQDLTATLQTDMIPEEETTITKTITKKNISITGL